VAQRGRTTTESFALDGGRPQLPGHPVTLVADLVRGRLGWPRYGIVALARVLVVAGALATSVGLLVSRVRGGRGRVDRAATHMGRGRELHALERTGAAATAQRLAVDAPGLPIAQTLAGVDVAGPRTGRSRGRPLSFACCCCVITRLIEHGSFGAGGGGSPFSAGGGG